MIAMGGRGGSSGLGFAPRTTPEQKRIIGNMERVLERDSTQGYSKPTFKTNKDGSVSYEYTRTRKIEHVHGSKMQSPEKNDTYERTEHYSGVIMRDGLRRANKTTKDDVLIRKGRSPRRRKR